MEFSSLLSILGGAMVLFALHDDKNQIKAPKFKCDNKEEAIIKFNDFKNKWESKYPKVIYNTEKNLGKLLRFYNYPSSIWRSLNFIIASSLLSHLNILLLPLIFYLYLHSQEPICLYLYFPYFITSLCSKEVYFPVI